MSVLRKIEQSIEQSEMSLVAVARRLIEERQARYQWLDGSIFAEPSWDILLDLYVALHHARPISVSSACLAANVPATTALRHLESLRQLGLIRRLRCENDKRTVYVQLTEKGKAAIAAYLRDISTQSV